MALETRWYDDCDRNAYCVLVMDPDTSGVTWEGVQTLLATGEALPATVFVATWGYEEEGADKTAYIESCKVEAQRLAELALTPPTPPTVTLLD